MLCVEEDYDDADEDDFLDGVEGPEDIEALDLPSPANHLFIVMAPVPVQNRWLGYDSLTYISSEIISSSRLGEDEIAIPSAIGDSTTTSCIPAPLKITKSETGSVAGSVGFAVVGNVGGSLSNSRSENIVDAMDINGDRYPDVVGEKKTQFTNARGGLEEVGKDNENELNMDDDESHVALAGALGISLGGSFTLAKVPNTQDQGKGGNKSKENQKARNANISENASDASSDSKEALGLSASASFNVNQDSTTYSWLDVNGDGLPDKVSKNGEVQLNLGYKFAPKENWGYDEVRDGLSKDFGGGLGININNGSIKAGAGLSFSENFTRGALQDVNGDGLLDMVKIKFDDPSLDIFGLNLSDFSLLQGLSFDNSKFEILAKINKGNGFANEWIEWKDSIKYDIGSSNGESINGAFTYCIPAVFVRICINPSGSANKGVSRQHTQLSDINGDGYPDFLTSDNDGHLTVARSTIGRTNMLHSVIRPMGADFSVTYKREGNTYEMPNSVWTLDSVRVYDGFAGDGADTLLTTYAFEDGFFERNEREFYGFHTVRINQHNTEQSDEIYRTTIQTFNNDNYYKKGLLESEVLVDADGNKFTETLNEYGLQDVENGSTLATDFNDDNGAAFPGLSTMTKNFYEGQSTPGETTSMTYAYDKYGNVTDYDDLGDTSPDDDLRAEIEYHEVLSNYIVGMPNSIEVTGSGTTYRKRQTDIDNSTGNITQIRRYLQSGDFSTHDMTYDAFGNLETITRPENHQGERLMFTFEYDPEVNIYTTQVSDSYGYSSQATYDVRFGQLLTSTSMNNQQMVYQIDDVGRITDITGPYEVAAGVPFTIHFDYFPHEPVPYALTQHYDPAHPGNFIETYTFTDGLTRVLQIKKDGAIFTASGQPDEERMIVSGRVQFDAFGRTTHGFYPTTEALGQGNAFNPTPDNIDPTVTSYDVLDRPLTVTLPDNAMTVTAYDFGDDRFGESQFKTTVIDANGNVKEKFTDVRGRVTSTLDYISTSDDLWTGFRYNAINELIEATDHDENAIVSAYDWFGRRTSVDHPDGGLTEMEYDLADNMTQRQTAVLRETDEVITYQYDHERLMDILYPQYTQNNVHYAYGEAGAAFNRAGRIVFQEDATGAQEFFYGPLGETVKNIRTILIPNAEEQVYTTEWTYDTWNRVTDMIYPDGEELTYTYNVGGLLHSMGGVKEGTDYPYLTQLGYDKFEQRVYCSYGNGTETTYAYEADRRRLEFMTATTAEGRRMIDNEYLYDNVTNILSITNSAPVPSPNLMGGPATQTFEYDDLYRLTHAEGDWESSNVTHRYTLDMGYNNVHDILNKNQVHEKKSGNGNNWIEQSKTTYDWDYAYDNTDQPHTATEIGEKNYAYDANGNLAEITHDVNGQTRELEWDEENRLQTLSDNGLTHHYTYDAVGERVLKGQGNGQQVFVNGELVPGNGGIGNYTIYVNPYVVVRSGNFTKHFFIESQRIVSKLGESGNGNANGSGNNGNGNGNNNDNGNNGNGNNGNNNGLNQEAFQFYYHPDHLGSSSYITDASGEVYQHLEYFPYGETFVEEHSNTHRTPYLYNGKELDEETGLYYYGARYYMPQESRWLSVDPLAEKYTGFSPYSYTLNNPIVYVDPDGEDPKKSSIKLIQRTKNHKSTKKMQARYHRKNNERQVKKFNQQNKILKQRVRAFNSNFKAKRNKGDNLFTIVHDAIREKINRNTLNRNSKEFEKMRIDLLKISLNEVDAGESKPYVFFFEKTRGSNLGTDYELYPTLMYKGYALDDQKRYISNSTVTVKKDVLGINSHNFFTPEQMDGIYKRALENYNKKISEEKCFIE